MEEKKPATQPQPQPQPQSQPRPHKPARDKERDPSAKTPRESTASKQGRQSSSASTALAELSAFKMPRKNSRLSDAQSVNSDDSERGSVRSSSSLRPLFGDDMTPLREPGSATKKRTVDILRREDDEVVTESPAKKATPVKTIVMQRNKNCGDAQGTVDLRIDLHAAAHDDKIDIVVGTDTDLITAPTGHIPETIEPEEEMHLEDSIEMAQSEQHSVDGDIIAADSSEEDVLSGRQGPAEEMTPRHKRAAAVMAKTKLNTRKHLDEKELEKELISAGITVGVEGEGEMDETGLEEGGNRRGSKSGKKSAARGGGRSQRRDVAIETVPAEEDKYACCDLCQKWRKLPQHVDTTALPDQWNCSMNVWDSERNNCRVPEEVFGEPSKASSQEGAIDDAASRSRNNRKGGTKRRRSDTADDVDDQGIDADGKKRSNKMRMSLEGKSPRTDNGTPLIPEQWVQCDKCTKWRKVAAGIDPEDLPKVWYCTMNTWNLPYARCGARQEKSQERSPCGGSEDFVPPAGRGKYVRRPNADRPEAAVGQTPLTSVLSGHPGVPVKKVTQWVQCERKNCQKWRKVGANIDMESLPEKWFCEMNTWDYDRATCDAPEEDASDTEGAGASGISTQLIIGNSKGANALSYRRLIFSQDGRLRPAYSEKNKFGHGIFSHSEVHNANDADEYVAPTRSIGYWWSTAYDDLIGAGYSTGSKRHPTVLDPGAKKNQIKDPDTLNNLSRQHEFDLIDGVTVVSKRDQWPSVIEQAPIPDADPHGDIAGGVFHLVDAYRRMHRMQCPHSMRNANAMLAKSFARRSRMSLQDIMRAETNVVKSCILGSYDENEQSNQPVTTAEGFGNITFSCIWSTVQSARFLSSNDEACRVCLTATSLKAVIRRLEEADYLRVVFSGEGELCVYLLAPLSNVIRSRKWKQNSRDFAKIGHCGEMEPIKGSVDPMFGTAYYWGSCGEKERLFPKQVDKSGDDVNFANDQITTNWEPATASIQSPIGEPAALVAKKYSLVFGTARPPLKLRKLLKSHYCNVKSEKDK